MGSRSSENVRVEASGQGEQAKAHIRTRIIVALVLTGHVVAVYLAHLVALRMSGDRRKALRSHLPVLALMVLYTTFSHRVRYQPSSRRKRCRRRTPNPAELYANHPCRTPYSFEGSKLFP